jgi:hypothetical protein
VSLIRLWRPDRRLTGRQEVTGRYLENAELTVDSFGRPIIIRHHEDGQRITDDVKGNIDLPITVSWMPTTSYDDGLAA